MSTPTTQLQQSVILDYAKQLRLPTLAGQFVCLAEEAARQGQTHLSYLEALLEAEIEGEIAKRHCPAHCGRSLSESENTRRVRV